MAILAALDDLCVLVNTGKHFCTDLTSALAFSPAFSRTFSCLFEDNVKLAKSLGNWFIALVMRFLSLCTDGTDLGTIDGTDGTDGTIGTNGTIGTVGTGVSCADGTADGCSSKKPSPFGFGYVSFFGSIFKVIAKGKLLL